MEPHFRLDMLGAQNAPEGWPEVNMGVRQEWGSRGPCYRERLPFAVGTGTMSCFPTRVSFIHVTPKTRPWSPPAWAPGLGPLATASHHLP